MTLPFAKRAYLLHPGGLLAERFLRAPTGSGVERFTGLRDAPGERPALAIASAPSQQDRQRIPYRRNQNQI